MLAIGAPEHSTGADRDGYTVDEATTEAAQAYARFTRRERASYREGWLPG